MVERLELSDGICVLVSQVIVVFSQRGLIGSVSPCCAPSECVSVGFLYYMESDV